MNKSTLIILSLLFTGFSCKTSTTPQPVDCDLGYHPCEYDETNCCIDTTSHNFVWGIDTLGIYGSTLNDVAIVDENNIWVVGNIRMPDPDSSNGTGYQEYNAAHWDGSEWELIGIYSNTLDLYSIKYFSDDDIWVLGSYPIHWDGEVGTLFQLTNMGIIPGGLSGDIWANSPSNIYFIGRYGRIVLYDGVNFEQIESGTDVDLIDITGTENGEFIFISGYNWSGESVALEISDSGCEILYEGMNLNSEPYGRIKSVDVAGIFSLFGCTEGLWKYNYLTSVSQLITLAELSWDNSINQVISNALNDIVIVSNWGMVNHFNGENWKLDEQLASLVSNDGSFQIRGASYDENLLIVSGIGSGYYGAIIINGVRY